MSRTIFQLAVGSILLSAVLDASIARLIHGAWRDCEVGRPFSTSCWSASAVVLVMAAAGLGAWSGLLVRHAKPMREGRLPWARVVGFVAVSASIALGAAWLLKTMIGRARPNAEGWDALSFQPWQFDNAFASFPSGQATLSGTAAISFCLLLPHFRPIILLFGMTVGLSRVAVEAHWLSDVVAGWMLGGGIAMACAARFGVLGRRP